MFNLTDKQLETIKQYCGNDYYVKPQDQMFADSARVVFFAGSSVHELYIFANGVIGAHLVLEQADRGWQIV